MSTKKILLIIAGVVIVLGLIVALFAGGIVFFVFRTIGTSEAAETARTYLRNNEALKQEIGEVKDFGWLVTGNINVTNGDGVATLYLKAIGEKGEANTRVDLGYRNNRDWRVTGASYTRDGKTVDLMQAYGPPTSNSP
jgi:glutamate/tyrosine decarboxylase-like PLP-dependent enzyme